MTICEGCRWAEIPAEVGAPLWRLYRTMLGAEPRQIGVYATITDPDGAYGGPCVMTTVGLYDGDVPLLRCEDTWDSCPHPRGSAEWEANKAATIRYRYWVPDGSVPDDA